VLTPNVPNEAEQKRLHADLTGLIGRIAPDQQLGIAFSGGPDSLALLLLCQAAFPGQTQAATVDHGLRTESADEARHCAAICAGLGVSHTILTPAAPITGSLQAAARAARYQLLSEWADAQAINHILTGHHADDQAETLLMRLNRGSGLAGLSGIRAVNGRVIRPLLAWRRAELAAISAASGLAMIHDPSNGDDRFDRVRMRKALAESNWINQDALAVSAAALGDAERSLNWMVDRLANDHITTHAGLVTLTQPDQLPVELRRRLVLRALALLDTGCKPSGPELGRLIATLAAGGKASIGGLMGHCTRSGWNFSHAPPRKTPRKTIG
jgi:tRNA(Ile)-lysidine synthase